MLHGFVLGLVLIGALISLFATKALPLVFDNSAPITGLSLPGVGAVVSDEPVLTSAVLPDTVRRGSDGIFASTGVGTGQPSVVAGRLASLPYELYVVQEGDSAGAIADSFGIDMQYLLWANASLFDGELIEVGYVLIVPKGNGIVHYVRYGETLSDIGARYGVDVSTIVSWPSNGISSADDLIEDAIIFVPGGEMPVAPLPEPTPLPTEEPIFVEADPTAPSAPLAAAVEAPAPPAAAPVVPSGNGGLIWPASGPISSFMGAGHPLGIDIDLFNNPFSSIVAATSGTVTFAGGDPCCSYGLYVVVVSPSGIETLYAHLSSLSVAPGQVVGQGAFLGSAGCTGYCTGNHLHFEVIDNGVRVNPLAYLP